MLFKGVAFEQGKLLPTPETIPFRLTRDIVDGMGVFGIEGVFRRCCEKTLTVLKDSKEALITIVEVSSLSSLNILMRVSVMFFVFMACIALVEN